MSLLSVAIMYARCSCVSILCCWTSLARLVANVQQTSFHFPSVQICLKVDEALLHSADRPFHNQIPQGGEAEHRTFSCDPRDIIRFASSSDCSSFYRGICICLPSPATVASVTVLATSHLATSCTFALSFFPSSNTLLVFKEISALSVIFRDISTTEAVGILRRVKANERASVSALLHAQRVAAQTDSISPQ